METHIITKEQLDHNNNYIGSVDLGNFKGNLEAEDNLGYVRFKHLKILGSIYFGAGSGIEAGDGIEAGFGIAGKTISSDLRIFAGLCLWRLPEPEEMKIRAKLLKGTIAFGELVEPENEVEELQKVTLEVTEDQLNKIKSIIGE